MRPSLTLSYGVRWEGQGPMHDPKGIVAVPDLASIYGPSQKLFAPGQLSGNNNPQLQAGVVPYKGDYNNFAPTGGFAWNPTYEHGLLGKIFGGSATVIRGSMNQVYYDEGTQFFAQNLGTNIS